MPLLLNRSVSVAFPRPITCTSLPSSPMSGGPDSKSGFKKGGFKNAFAPAEATAPPLQQQEGLKPDNTGVVNIKKEEVKRDEAEEGESESDDGEDGEKYDPKKPTGCWDGCAGRHVHVGE